MSLFSPEAFMGTVSSSLFNGTSRFSDGLQSAIDRATAIASMPISLLKGQIDTLDSQTKAMTDLDAPFKALQNSLEDIGAALNGSTFDAVISDDTKLSVTLGDQAGE